MFNSAVLDVAIGLIFVYLLLSLICTTVNEAIASWFQRRAKNLREAISALLDGHTGKDAPNADKLYAHPLIAALRRKGKEPSYIPGRAFAQALLDIAAPDKGQTVEAMLNAIGKDSPHLQKSLQALLRGVEPKMDAVLERIEGWFNNTMDRAGGWYKRKAQLSAALLAIAITLVMNADTVQIVRHLWVNPTLRAKIVEQAKARSEKPLTADYTDAERPEQSKIVDHSSADDSAKLTDQEREALGELLGWESNRRALAQFQAHNPDKKDFLSSLGWTLQQHLLGWLLTMIAVSLGAPFWFDVLQKAMQLRSSGKVPETKKPESAPAGAK
jgi:hypothetical protein